MPEVTQPLGQSDSPVGSPSSLPAFAYFLRRSRSANPPTWPPSGASGVHLTPGTANERFRVFLTPLPPVRPVRHRLGQAAIFCVPVPLGHIIREQRGVGEGLSSTPALQTCAGTGKVISESHVHVPTWTWQRRKGKSLSPADFSPCSQLPWWEQFGEDTIGAGSLSSFRPGGWWAPEPSNGHPARPACSSGVGPVVRPSIPDYSPAPAGPVCLPLPGVSELGTASPARARGRPGALGHPSPVWKLCAERARWVSVGTNGGVQRPQPTDWEEGPGRRWPWEPPLCGSAASSETLPVPWWTWPDCPVRAGHGPRGFPAPHPPGMGGNSGVAAGAGPRRPPGLSASNCCRSEKRAGKSKIHRVSGLLSSGRSGPRPPDGGMARPGRGQSVSLRPARVWEARAETGWDLGIAWASSLGGGACHLPGSPHFPAQPGVCWACRGCDGHVASLWCPCSPSQPTPATSCEQPSCLLLRRCLSAGCPAQNF